MAVTLLPAAGSDTDFHTVTSSLPDPCSAPPTLAAKNLKSPPVLPQHSRHPHCCQIMAHLCWIDEAPLNDGAHPWTIVVENGVFFIITVPLLSTVGRHQNIPTMVVVEELHLRHCRRWMLLTHEMDALRSDATLEAGRWGALRLGGDEAILHLVRSEGISIQDVTIFGNFNSPNNDGIDVEDSNNTMITRCHIDTGDDAICAKSSTGPVYNLTATDCWIRTKSSAIKLGSASSYTFGNFTFHNITIVESHRGLALQIRDGGNVSDITFSNINISTRYYDPLWWGRAEPIYVTTCPRDASSKPGFISNIQFLNITSTSENGVFLSGSGGGLLGNLKFRDVNLTFTRWTNYSDGLLDYRPGCKELVSHKTAGFMMEHIDGLEIDNVFMRWHTKKDIALNWNNPLDFRPSTVNNISLLNFFSKSYQE